MAKPDQNWIVARHPLHGGHELVAYVAPNAGRAEFRIEHPNDAHYSASVTPEDAVALIAMVPPA